jgi:hypothetical protein
MPAIETTIEAVATLVQVALGASAAAIQAVIDAIAHAIGSWTVLVEASVYPIAAVVAVLLDALTAAIETVVHPVARVWGRVGVRQGRKGHHGHHAGQPEPASSRHMSAPVHAPEIGACLH